ncbi:MAG: TIGR03984 family CRISPR-associated protein [Chloroflexi bacterium CFX4]|nr:TIGR03984 family CRISPR-associated protein [Chloroflexi bacterium CFX4]MDL1924121.1 TIGR03984 family CRISPR-associated protein [Chloroflexi bacterium CFX3]
MKRTIQGTTTSVSVEPSPVAVDPIDPVKWLQEQVGSAGNDALLLAHADDGVIWGKVVNNELIPKPQELKTETLQQARLFNENAEYFVWRDSDGNFHARIIKDGMGEGCEYFDEDQILWGDHAEKSDSDGFTKMSDGAQGLVHHVPINVTKAKPDWRPLRLTVRHYLKTDDNGFVYVAFSRLVCLKEVGNG